MIDARLGCMWHLQLRLDCLAKVMEDKSQLVDSLLRRKQGKGPLWLNSLPSGYTSINSVFFRNQVDLNMNCYMNIYFYTMD